ncbi:HTH-type transcriptional regulator BetI [Paenibacillus polymyxa E681]|jgi:AcrR family transcriptional regulator|uniref:TetR/AcrR family transcriptional regulator n=1 Tax=Paenibacillus TaxID=44249 RepID=UPI0001E320E1|nr:MULTISPECIES: TetR/AcrR family transcriptional regulator [Paenibacillus]ADM72283.1 transcriptional regulator [Paenibacillus polymyxa E681]QNV59307.1 HTH-type transcriptional regulator BetI [Paenibacillus polymyxa E681]QNV64133.1 HTH-type transcriptional regulator BetI [Paenibacillus polymyxa E681]QYK69782.1 Bacterial regulatory protein, tetR family [Paenibacillus sp. S02]URJ43361.3 TetR/AcrR family transcriptional regulator [Paenibacillus polymyxa]
MKHIKRRERESSEIRRKIIEAARSLFLNQGYAEVSMRKIADQIEYSPTTIYHYFANKEAVVRELLIEGNTLFLQALQQRVDEAQAAGSNALDTLKTVSDAYVRFGTANPEYYNILFISNLESVSLVSLIDSGRFKGFELLEAGLKAAMEEGCIIQGDERLIARSVWSMLHGLTSLLLNFELPMAKSNDELIAFTIDTFLRGLSR